MVGVFGACASSSGPKNDGGAGGICPNNPQQCGGKCCGDQCLTVQADRKNCGDCGVECPAGEVCGGGTCGCPVGPVASGNVMKCPQGQNCCGAAGCKNLQTDTKNCGACGTACAMGATCAGGQCICGGRACGVGEVCCNGACSTTCALDMAMPARDMGGSSGGTCTCASGCPLSGLCVGQNCCYEDILLGSSCTPDPACLGI